MVEKNVKHNAGIAPASLAETRQRAVDQGVCIGKHINAAMQLDRSFDLWTVLTLQPSFYKVAVQASE